MIVMKFGGTSVADSEAITRVMSIVNERLDKHPIVVVSALSKVTDTLYKICDFAERGITLEALMLVENIRERHLQLVSELIASNEDMASQARDKVNSLCDSLKKLVEVICDLGELSDRSRARIISTGEYLSSGVICHALNAYGITTNLLDARKIIITDDNWLKGEPDLKKISEIVPAIVKKAYERIGGEDAEVLITQGFVSATEDGRPTVLGRGGSDYSASIIGMAMDADEIEIWTDVDGVHTADPRKVEGTRSLEAISFKEAAEMAHSGAKVLHPSTMEPAVSKDIPIKVLNSRRPEHRGTLILGEDGIPSGVKSVSGKDRIRVVNIFSSRTYNASGFLGKVFSMFSKYHVSMDLITMSEGTVSVTVGEDEDISQMIDELSEFSTVFVETDKAQIAIVGKEMVFAEGVLEKIFKALEGYPVYLVSQGASCNNVSVVVDRANLDGAIARLHKALFE